MLIAKHVALKVGQGEGDLHPQSQLDPWSQIKRWMLTDGGNMALSASTTQSQTHGNSQTSLRICTSLFTHTHRVLSDYPQMNFQFKIHFSQVGAVLWTWTWFGGFWSWQACYPVLFSVQLQSVWSGAKAAALSRGLNVSQPCTSSLKQALYQCILNVSLNIYKTDSIGCSEYIKGFRSI